MSEVDLSEILRLPVSERIALVERIWDSVAADSESVPVTPEQREELDRRLREHDQDPADVVPWTEAEERIRSRLNR